MRKVLVYLDRSSGEWVILANRAGVSLEEVKGLGLRQAMERCGTGSTIGVIPGKTYSAGLLKDLQWYTWRLLEQEWVWR